MALQCLLTEVYLEWLMLEGIKEILQLPACTEMTRMIFSGISTLKDNWLFTPLQMYTALAQVTKVKIDERNPVTERTQSAPSPPAVQNAKDLRVAWKVSLRRRAPQHVQDFRTLVTSPLKRILTGWKAGQYTFAMMPLVRTVHLRTICLTGALATSGWACSPTHNT